MADDNFFRDPKLKFWVVGPAITESQISSVVPDTFGGKMEFLRFYVRHNGGCFEGRGAIFYRDKFYPVARGDYNSMEIESFFFVPLHPGERFSGLRSLVRVREQRAQYYSELKSFIETHFPFAGDAGDNDYWIEIPSGRVKYIRWESFPEGAVDIAPSFYDFVSNFASERRPSAT